MATDDDDAATLRERVRDLEATVAQQQDTIQQLMPSRRAILAGGAGLVGGAALTGQASAQSAAGQVGTSSEPVDVEAATVTADSLNTGRANIAETAVRLTVPEQIILSNTTTKTQYDEIVFEDSQIFTADLNNNNISVDVDGTYYLASRVMWADSTNWSSGDPIIHDIKINGANNVRTLEPHVGTNTRKTQTAESVVKLSAGDTVTTFCFQNSGNDQFLQTDAKRSKNFLTIARVG